jgi:hypothetical protein
MTLLEQIQQNLLNLPPEKQGEVLDFVTFLQERFEKERASTASTRQKRLKKSLSELAKFGTFKGIKDPSAWQREIRQDRLLPGREA